MVHPKDEDSMLRKALVGIGYKPFLSSNGLTNKSSHILHVGSPFLAITIIL